MIRLGLLNKIKKNEYINDKNIKNIESSEKSGMISLKDFHNDYLKWDYDSKIISNISQFHLELKRDIPLIKTVSIKSVPKL